MLVPELRGSCGTVMVPSWHDCGQAYRGQRSAAAKSLSNVCAISAITVGACTFVRTMLSSRLNASDEYEAFCEPINTEASAVPESTSTSFSWMYRPVVVSGRTWTTHPAAVTC